MGKTKKGAKNSGFGMKFVLCKLSSETKCFAISNDVSGAWSRAPFLRILKANETKTPRKLSEKKCERRGTPRLAMCKKIRRNQISHGLFHPSSLARSDNMDVDG